MAFCNKCGKKVSEDDEFCPICGKNVPIKKSAIHETRSVSTQGHNPIVNPNQALHIGLIVLAVFIVLYFAIPKSTSTDVYCGDGICQSSESCSSCSSDCGQCNVQKTITPVSAPPTVTDVIIEPIGQTQFSITMQKNYGTITLRVTNIGNTPMDLYFWAPNTRDESGRSSNELSCSWRNEDYSFALKPNENKEIELTCGIYSAQFLDGTLKATQIYNVAWFTVPGYVYAFGSAGCGTQAKPLDLFVCHVNALFTRRVDLKVIVS